MAQREPVSAGRMPISAARKPWSARMWASYFLLPHPHDSVPLSEAMWMRRTRRNHAVRPALGWWGSAITLGVETWLCKPEDGREEFVAGEELRGHAGRPVCTSPRQSSDMARKIVRDSSPRVLASATPNSGRQHSRLAS